MLFDIPGFKIGFPLFKNTGLIVWNFLLIGLIFGKENRLKRRKP
jgi:hypothetical protein